MSVNRKKFQYALKIKKSQDWLTPMALFHNRFTETIAWLILVKLLAYFDNKKYDRFYVYYFIDKVFYNVISLYSSENA